MRRIRTSIRKYFLIKDDGLEGRRRKEEEGGIFMMYKFAKQDQRGFEPKIS